MITGKDYFPSKLAKGDRFCNRLKEKEMLRRNIELARHTVLVAPRRYGKSSLVHQVLSQVELPYADIDLFLAHNDQAIVRRILDGLAGLFSQIMPLSQKAMVALQKYFSHIQVGLMASGFSLQAIHTSGGGLDVVEQIYEALKGLAELAKQENKKIVIFIDEFQDIENAESSRSIQGAIRNVAQNTDHLVFIFSGSARHLLLQLFDERSQPLYLLCDKMNLDRMTSQHYEPYVQEAVISKWGRKLEPEAFKKMMLLTELHPFYVNMLGNELLQSEIFPGDTEVLASWVRCVSNEKRRVVSQLDALTLNQLKVLKTLSFNPIMEPYAHDFLVSVGLSVSSVKASLKALLEKDLVFQVTFEDELVSSFKRHQYRVLDPLLSFSLRYWESGAVF
jgi:AAA+ ATPase superfamily predicted ATPase